MEKLIFNNIEHKELYHGDTLIWSKPNYITWSGTNAIWTNGTGTVSNPFLIETPEHLAYLSYIVSTNWQAVRDKYFLQTNDFDLNNIPFTSIGGRDVNGTANSTYTVTFVYDGGNHKIKNLNIKIDNGMYFGLFGIAWYGTISNVKLVDVNYSPDLLSKTYVAGILGANAISVINNCHVLGNSTIYGSYASPICSIAQQGGITSKSTIINCSTGSLVKSICANTGTSRSAGILCFVNNYTHVANCVNRATLSCISPTNGQCGGIVGAVNTNSDLVITKCVNTGKIFNTTYAAGILPIYRFTKITYSGNSGEINGRTYSGGLSCYMYGTTPNLIDSCYNIGTVKCSGYPNNGTSYVSGIASVILSSTTISNTYNKGYILGDTKSRVGGIVGYTQTSTLNLDKCYNSANIIGDKVNGVSGSIVGYKADSTTANVLNVFNNKDLCTLDFVGTQNISVSNFNKISDELKGNTLSGIFSDTVWEFVENDLPKIKLV